MTCDIKARVTVALPVHNAERTLEISIRSIIAQTFPHWTLLVLDDGSHDRSVEIARSFADPRIRVFADGHNRGLAARLNQAIEHTETEYFARMDADDVSYPRRFEEQIGFLDTHPEVDLLGTGALVFDDDHRPLGLLPCPVTHEQICRRPWGGFYLAHPTWMGRHTWFATHRYRADALKAQDAELLLRTFDRSRFASLPEVLLGYRQDSLMLGKILRTRWHLSRAFVREAMRRGRPGTAARAVAGQVARAAFESAVIPLGLGQRALRHRAQPLPQQEIARWQACLAGCRSL